MRLPAVEFDIVMLVPEPVLMERQVVVPKDRSAGADTWWERQSIVIRAIVFNQTRSAIRSQVPNIAFASVPTPRTLLCLIKIVEVALTDFKLICFLSHQMVLACLV